MTTEPGFSLVRGAPDPRLEGLVRGYADFAERTSGPVVRHEPATPDAVVLVDLDAGWTIGKDAPEHHGSFAGGLYDGPVTVGHEGRARAVQVDLTPLGARALLGVPLGELTRSVVALDRLLGDDAERLAERLHDAPSSAARFALLDRTLLRRAGDAGDGLVRPDVARAWRRLEETSGALRVDALAAELGCSRRHLTGRFAEEVGLPPKAYGRVLRFRRASELLRAGAGRPQLADVAATCGYADQAHLSREVRALAGVTPTELADHPGGA